MTNFKSTKKALLMSVLSLVLCFSMLIGTTFAWFTDSVTSANNIIKSGNLDIELEYWNGTAWVDVSGKSDILTNTLWEPGVTEVAYLRVKNAGSLALKYQLGINIVDEVAGINAAGNPFLLSDYIQFGVVEGIAADAATKVPTTYATREDAVKAVTDAKKISAGYTKAASMAAGGELYFALVVYMPTEVNNAANHDGTNVPKIDLGINVIATQVAAEEDSFNNEYDKGAVYLENVSATEEVPTNATEAITLTAEDVEVTIPAALLNALPDDVTSIALAYSEPKVEGKTITFGAIEFVDQNGEVIDFAALNTTETYTTKIPVEGVFENGDVVALYHDGEMVAGTTVANGYATYEAPHFCEVKVVDAESVYDYVVSDLAGLTEAFAKGGKVLMAADIQFEKILAVEPGAEVYLNMNGKKITVNQATTSNTLIYVKDGAKLVVDGNGTIDLEAVSTMAIFAPYGELVIENGTFIRNKVTTITNKTTGLFMGAKTINSNVTINGGYFDAGYYDVNAADIEAILAGEKTLAETADDIAKRNNSKDANLVRVALKDNISAVLNHSGYGTFKIYGGTFVGMNPAWGDEGCMLPTTPDYLRPWSYYQGAFLDGQTFNENGIVLPEGYTITMVVNEAGVPVYTVTYNK